MLNQARQIIEKALAESQHPVVMCSFGKESMLLLALLRQYIDIDVLWCREDLTKEQLGFAHQVILDWDLTVYTYAPTGRYFLPNAKGLTLVNEYSIAHSRFPVLVDTEYSDKCALDISKERTPFFSFHWDTCLIGWRASDEHFVTGKNPFPPDGTQLGSTRLYAPLRDLSESDVWKLTRRLKVPVNEKRYSGDSKYDPDILHACTRCLDSEEEVFCPKEQAVIPPHVWDREMALNNFRTRFLAQEVSHV